MLDLSEWSYRRQGLSVRVRVLAAMGVLVLLAIGVLVMVASGGSPPPVGTALVQESVSDTGYTGNVVLTNSGTEPAVGWTVELVLPKGTRIVSHWDASMGGSGQRYRFAPAPHNGRIEPGGVVAFGFTTEGTGLPTDCRTNGQECVAPEDRTAPPIPEQLRLTQVSVSLVGLAWDPVEDDHGFVAYRIYGGPEATVDASAELLAGSPSTEMVINGLTPATSYVFTVSAVDAAGNESPRGSRVTVRTGDGADTIKPSAPTELTVQASTSTTVELTWDAAEDNTSVTEYRVYEDADVVAVSTSLSARITGLAPGSTLRYQVTAADEAENESARSRAVAVTLPPSSPSATSSPTPSSNTSTNTPPPPPPGTLISRGRPATTSTQAQTTDGKKDFGPERAVDGRTDTRWATKRGIDPSWLRIDLGGHARLSRIRLIWDPACATRYTIQTSTEGKAWESVFTTSKGDGGTDDIAVGGSGRYVQIVGQQRCRSDSGYSIQELEVYGTIDQPGSFPDTKPPRPPTNLRAGTVTTATIALTWTAPTGDVGIAGYDIYHNGDLLRSVEAPTTSTTLTNLAPNTQYRLTAIARDKAGDTSPSSNMITITTLSNNDNRPPTINGPIRTTSITATAVALDWNDATDDADHILYDIYAGNTKIGTVKESCVIITGLAANTQYQFRVKARDPAGNNSPPSNAITVKTRRNGGGSAPSPTPAERPLGGTRVGNVSVVAKGLNIPWGITFLPNGDALVGERDTFDVHRVTQTAAKTKVGHVPNGETTGGEGGLLGLALSPTFASDHLLYAYHTSGSDNRVVRMRYENDKLGHPQVILTGIPRNRFHNGGRIIFGPDKLLYIGTGDAQKGSNAQSKTSLGGKILRVTPDGKAAEGNPFGNAIFSYGHRNVQGLWFDSKGRLWASEFGDSDRDEVNQIRSGMNYGWPECEGSCRRGGFVDPVHEWPVAQASPSGLCIVGDTIFMASLRGTRLWRMEIKGSDIKNVKAYFVGTYGRLRTVMPAQDGSLWMTTSNRDNNGRPTAGDDRILRIELE